MTEIPSFREYDGLEIFLEKKKLYKDWKFVKIYVLVPTILNGTQKIQIAHLIYLLKHFVQKTYLLTQGSFDFIYFIFSEELVILLIKQIVYLDFHLEIIGFLMKRFEVTIFPIDRFMWLLSNILF